MTKSSQIVLLYMILLHCGVLHSQEDLSFDLALYSGSTGFRGSSRSAVFRDSFLNQYATGTWRQPEEGDNFGLDFRGRLQKWTEVELDGEGTLQSQNVRGGYLYLTHQSDRERIAIVRTNGNSELIVNGAPRAGDYYSKGRIILPVKLNAGQNKFLFRVGRGRKKSITMELPRKPIFLTAVDTTTPDFLTTEVDEKLAAIRIVNATQETLRGLSIVSNVAGVSKTTRLTESVAPLTTRKLPFTLHDGVTAAGPQTVQVSLHKEDTVIDELSLSIEVKEPTTTYRRTFVSDIDGSLQYYAVRRGESEEGRDPALFLSVHGAGVRANGQANSYQPKSWGHVIAPTNRREFGFDWEDWGRLDAMEALADAQNRYGTDPERTYLTGHSMGGHGTWYLGAVYPSKWAAIAPMAGWRSFFSYTRQRESSEPTKLERLLQRAANPSRTLEMSRNYLQHGIYIHHGDADRSVPVSEARFMREHLAKFHPDVAYYEEPGGAHWYGVDHQPVFDYFQWHQRKDVRDLETLHFRVPSPGISANCRYITLYQQERAFEFCGVVAKQTIRSRRQRRNNEDITEREIEIETENLKIFKLDLDHCRNLQRLTVEVDGTSIDALPWPESTSIWLGKRGEAWEVIDEPTDVSQKNPKRYGGFKDAFRHRVLFVYSTGGTEEENQASFDKARFDAESFYYRGNGSIELIADSSFDLQTYADRSVIVYGNATINKAWDLLLGNSPIQVRRGELVVGDRVLAGEQYGIYMVRSRDDSDVASVGVVASTGRSGSIATIPNRYFLAGTGYPDFMVMTPDMYADGASGVVTAGYFDNGWNLDPQEMEW